MSALHETEMGEDATLKQEEEVDRRTVSSFSVESFPSIIIPNTSNNTNDTNDTNDTMMQCYPQSSYSCSTFSTNSNFRSSDDVDGRQERMNTIANRIACCRRRRNTLKSSMMMRRNTSNQMVISAPALLTLCLLSFTALLFSSASTTATNSGIFVHALMTPQVSPRKYTPSIPIPLRHGIATLSTTSTTSTSSISSTHATTSSVPTNLHPNPTTITNSATFKTKPTQHLSNRKSLHPITSLQATTSSSTISSISTEKQVSATITNQINCIIDGPALTQLQSFIDAESITTSSSSSSNNDNNNNSDDNDNKKDIMNTMAKVGYSTIVTATINSSKERIVGILAPNTSISTNANDNNNNNNNTTTTTNTTTTSPNAANNNNNFKSASSSNNASIHTINTNNTSSSPFSSNPPQSKDIRQTTTTSNNNSNPSTTTSTTTTNNSNNGVIRHRQSIPRRKSGSNKFRTKLSSHSLVGSSLVGNIGSTINTTTINTLGNLNALANINNTHVTNYTTTYRQQKHMAEMYELIPSLEVTSLPRGGVSIDTEAVGSIQFGIPPETIKDSMRLGLEVPSVYIVPVERFCREMGPALGVNLAEFEFPAYFNFFVRKKRCTLIVDSDDAERNIRRVFSETLLGPARFRRTNNPLSYEEEDFAPDFPREAIPDFQKELKHFRMMPDGNELVIETLLNFCHFKGPFGTNTVEGKDTLGVPPPSMEIRFDEDGETEGSTAANAAAATATGSSTRKKSVESSSDDNIPEIVGGATDADEDYNISKDHDHHHHDSVIMDEKKNKVPSAYARVKLCEVAVVHPSDATQDEIENRKCRRVEIFKLTGGTEYVLHDIDENNIIVGKVNISGNVRIPESMIVDGFGGRSITNADDSVNKGQNFAEEDEEENDLLEDDHYADGTEKSPPPRSILPPTFHPPSFGVTVLGNSHGFDKSGSVSGYVLWINGRGVMIDPPPYSSATLEREGIRPRTIVGIILTHCHADHDAGAFQKVLTGSPVVVITTPTIYKSFIRKYAALSALSPALLRHSHRHKPAIIGAPLRFQGATFHFTYTLHSIPCFGFRVEWRGRSMVFTGDHFNSPPDISKLQETGVLSQARAQDLSNLPLQDADLLLHEAGAPPIHTPLDVLMKLPDRVKDRLYVVHTQALPPDCPLRVAPTGTAGTIRLDEKETSNTRKSIISNTMHENSMFSPSEYDTFGQSMFSSSEYDTFGENVSSLSAPNCYLNTNPRRNKESSKMSMVRQGATIPRVALRPTSSTDAWFILNLLSAVPFLTSLSYASTMEVLETARVDAFCKSDVVVPASRRSEVLCVVWEGTCMERECNVPSSRGGFSSNGRKFTQFASLIGGGAGGDNESKKKKRPKAVWHAGDWTGPRSLQPEKALSGDSSSSRSHDIVAMSQEGVKVITVEFGNLHHILKSGSGLYRTYLTRKARMITPDTPQCLKGTSTGHLFEDEVRNLNVIEILECNSTLRKLSAVQKRHLESLAEGPMYYTPGQRLWRAGEIVDKAFIVVSGTVSFVAMRRNAGSVGIGRSSKDNLSTTDNFAGEDDFSSKYSFHDQIRQDAAKVRAFDLAAGQKGDDTSVSSSISSTVSEDKEIPLFDGNPYQHTYSSTESIGADSLADNPDYAKLSMKLQKRADRHMKRDSKSTGSIDGDSVEYDSSDDDNDLHDYSSDSLADSDVMRRRSSKDRFVNKQLGRLYNRRAFTAGLVFSKGHFLGDISKMVAGLLSSAYDSNGFNHSGDEGSAKYGFGEKQEGNSNSRKESVSIIHEQEGDQLIVHSSTLAAGKVGCVVLVFPSSSLIPFLDEYPGLLLSLLGTQVVL